MAKGIIDFLNIRKSPNKNKTAPLLGYFYLYSILSNISSGVIFHFSHEEGIDTENLLILGIGMVSGIVVFWMAYRHKISLSIVTYIVVHYLLSAWFVEQEGRIVVTLGSKVLIPFLIFLTDYRLRTKFVFVVLSIIGFLVVNRYSYEVGLKLDFEELEDLTTKMGIQYMIMASFLGYIFYSLVRVNENKLVRERREVDRQKEIVEEKNKEMRDSINYAKRLQDGILPPIDQLNDIHQNSFIYYRPKDIVAGDFYWFHKKDDELFFTCSDCTGHGVPGAMLSVLGSRSYEKAVVEMGLTEPADILNFAREFMEMSFAKSPTDIQDGMDVAFCRLNLKTRKLVFAGANLSLYRVCKLKGDEDDKVEKDRDMGVVTYKGDHQPVALFDFKSPFSQVEIQLEDGDCIYMTSDGYPDQFGGESGKKFMIRNFKKTMLSLHTMPIKERAQYLDYSFENWMGKEEQADDVCVIGVQV